MAYRTNELFGKSDYDAYPRIQPTKVLPVTFGNDAAEPTVEVGTPVSFDSANFEWVVWSASGTGDVDEIKGFVYPDSFVLDSAGELIAQVMVAGEIHYDDVVLPSGESQSDLREALRAGCLERGLVIRGLSKVR